jgi:hypothetical protein
MQFSVSNKSFGSQFIRPAKIGPNNGVSEKANLGVKYNISKCQKMKMCNNLTKGIISRPSVIMLLCT